MTGLASNTTVSSQSPAGRRISSVVSGSIGRVQLREDRVNGRLRAGEHRRVAPCIEARLGITQATHQIDEFLWVVRVECDDEILVVDAVAVAGVQADTLERRGRGDMLGHHPLPRMGRQAVPRPGLRKRVYEQVLSLTRQQLDTLARVLAPVDIRRVSLERKEAVGLRQVGAQL